MMTLLIHDEVRAGDLANPPIGAVQQNVTTPQGKWIAERYGEPAMRSFDDLEAACLWVYEGA